MIFQCCVFQDISVIKCYYYLGIAQVTNFYLQLSPFEAASFMLIFFPNTTVSDPFSSSIEYFKPKNLKLLSVFILVPALAY